MASGDMLTEDPPALPATAEEAPTPDIGQHNAGGHTQEHLDQQGTLGGEATEHQGIPQKEDTNTDVRQHEADPGQPPVAIPAGRHVQQPERKEETAEHPQDWPPGHEDPHHGCVRPQRIAHQRLHHGSSTTDVVSCSRSWR